ncbi:uncharacterized protein VTP21DRAFT_3816 [Calcarisporiella thermophila]|uniref:uncharacterized protein n=1 Tax=Calcarisporiella thermophila TaxID=911321 RepID=UPI003743AC4E
MENGGGEWGSGRGMRRRGMGTSFLRRGPLAACAPFSQTQSSVWSLSSGNPLAGLGVGSMALVAGSRSCENAILFFFVPLHRVCPLATRGPLSRACRSPSPGRVLSSVQDAEVCLCGARASARGPGLCAQPGDFLNMLQAAFSAAEARLRPAPHHGPPRLSLPCASPACSQGAWGAAGGPGTG